MKVLLLITTLATMLMPSVAHGSELSTCKSQLAWQRMDYTKAHINVTQSLRGHAPKRTHWHRPTTTSQCHSAMATAKHMRRLERTHWRHLRLERPGVKWIIRRQFSKAGHWAVLLAWKVVSCESSFNPTRVSSTGDTGTWQINWVHHLPERVMRSPELSTGWAWRASSHGTNFSPTWVCASRLGIA